MRELHPNDYVLGTVGVGDNHKLEIGGPLNNRALTVILFDLTALAPHMDGRSSETLAAKLTFRHLSNVNGTHRIRVECLDEELAMSALPGETGPWPPIASASAAAKILEPTVFPFTLVADEKPLEFDLSAIVQHCLRLGLNRLVLRLSAADDTSFAAQPLRFDIDTSRVQFNVRATGRRGVHADVFTAGGRLLSEGSSIADLRGFEAGEYVVRVYDPLTWINERWQRQLPFEFQLSPPLVGDSIAPTDQDEIFGQEGHDLVVGNGFIDRIFGGPGLDAFEAQRLEIHDENHLAALPIFIPATDRVLQETENQAPVKVPDIAIVDNMPPPIDKEVNFTTLPLEAKLAIGHQLNLTYKGPDGQWRLRREIRASDMPRLVALNWANLASNNGRKVSLDPLEFAVNLEYLSAAGTDVTSLAPLVPGIHKLGTDNHARFGQLGTPHLRFLDLDDTPLNNQGVNLASANTEDALFMLGRLENLERLSIDRLRGSEQTVGEPPGATQLSDYQFEQLRKDGRYPGKTFYRLRVLSAVGMPEKSRAFTSLDGLPLTGDSRSPLEYLNLSHNRISDVRRLGFIDSLVALELADNPIRHLYPLAGVSVVDDRDDDYVEPDSGWTSSAATKAYSEHYRLLPEQLQGKEARFEIVDVVPGLYDVYVTYPPHGSRTSVAEYRVWSEQRIFDWKATDAAGRKFSGEEIAVTDREVRRKLEAQKLTPTAIERRHHQLLTITNTETNTSSDLASTSQQTLEGAPAQHLAPAEFRFDVGRDTGWKKLGTVRIDGPQLPHQILTIVVQGGADGNVAADAVALKRQGALKNLELLNLQNTAPAVQP